MREREKKREARDKWRFFCCHHSFRRRRRRHCRFRQMSFRQWEVAEESSWLDDQIRVVWLRCARPIVARAFEMRTHPWWAQQRETQKQLWLFDFVRLSPRSCRSWWPPPLTFRYSTRYLRFVCCLIRFKICVDILIIREKNNIGKATWSRAAKKISHHSDDSVSFLSLFFLTPTRSVCNSHLLLLELNCCCSCYARVGENFWFK